MSTSCGDAAKSPVPVFWLLLLHASLTKGNLHSPSFGNSPTAQYCASCCLDFDVVGVVDVDFLLVEHLHIILFRELVGAYEVVFQTGDAVDFFGRSSDVSRQVLEFLCFSELPSAILKYFGGRFPGRQQLVWHRVPSTF